MSPATNTRYLGVHAPDRAPGAANGYRAGALRAWLALLGLRDGGGAPVAVKLYDEKADWRFGDPPALSTETSELLRDCAVLNFRPVVSYCAFTKSNPGDEIGIQGRRGRLSDAMHRLVTMLPRGAAVLFGNEREKSWSGDPQTFFDLEAEFGFIARRLERGWYVGADLVEAHTMDTIQERMQSWRRFQVEPDAIAFHSYGQGGTLPRHVQDIADALQRLTGRKCRWPGPSGAGDSRAREPRAARAATSSRPTPARGAASSRSRCAPPAPRVVPSRSTSTSTRTATRPSPRKSSRTR
jgi:hypothetical protein